MSSEYSKTNQQIKEFKYTNLNFQKTLIQHQQQTKISQKKLKNLIIRKFPQSTVMSDKNNYIIINFKKISTQPQEIINLCHKSNIVIHLLQILTEENKVILKIQNDN